MCACASVDVYVRTFKLSLHAFACWRLCIQMLLAGSPRNSTSDASSNSSQVSTALCLSFSLHSTWRASKHISASSGNAASRRYFLWSSRPSHSGSTPSVKAAFTSWLLKSSYFSSSASAHLPRRHLRLLLIRPRRRRPYRTTAGLGCAKAHLNVR